MSSLAVAVPLALDSKNGFDMIESFKRLIKQNLKMLLLTAPGERMMDPFYGVGLRRYLFEQDTADLKKDLRQKINVQVQRYMPHINIQAITYMSPDDRFHPGMRANSLQLRISYSIPSMKEIAFLDIEVASGYI